MRVARAVLSRVPLFSVRHTAETKTGDKCATFLDDANPVETDKIKFDAMQIVKFGALINF